MAEELTITQLAERSGVPAAELGAWQTLGLLVAGERFEPDDVERAELIRFAVGRGYTPERLAHIAAAHGDMIGHFVESIRPYRGERALTMDEAAARAGVDRDVFDRVVGAIGMADQQMASEEDVQALAMLSLALTGGIPEDAFVQILRVFSDSLDKVADAASRLFHLYVHEQLRSGGAGGAELLEVTNAISAPLLGLIEPGLLFFNRKAWEKALREDMMLHLAEEATAPADVPGQFRRAILFVDLSSFTPLTEAMGDAAAAEVVGRFSQLVREATAHCSGQVVKQIGDEFMLVFADGRLAVRCGVTIKERAAAETRFPALRIGAHSGSVLYRDGDYVGTTVNLAARVTATAKRHQFLVTEAVAAELDGVHVEMTPAGAHSLKGLSEPVELFEVHAPHTGSMKSADPVCGMELDDGSAEADLNWRGRRLRFCSDGCLRLFLDDPDRYAATP